MPGCARYTMLRCAALCHVVLCYAVLRYGMRRYTMLSCYTIPQQGDIEEYITFHLFPNVPQQGTLKINNTKCTKMFILEEVLQQGDVEEYIK